jgi:two-component system chemotaxis response regulator CheY
MNTATLNAEAPTDDPPAVGTPEAGPAQATAAKAPTMAPASSESAEFDAATSTSPKAGVPTTHRCDFLIADDTGASREILAALLRQACPGVSIREARDGADAVNRWKEWRPRVTFLDIDMPGQNGLSVLQAIRSAQPDAFVAMVSGLSSADNVRQALSMGASGFIVKPFKPQRLIDVLERYSTLTGHALVTAH